MATTKQNQVIAGRMVEFQDKFSPLSNEDAQYVIQNAGEAIALFVKAVSNRARKKMEDEKIKKDSSIVQFISGGEKLMIEALDGKAYIADAKKVFKPYIDGDFKNWGLNQSGPATAETSLDVSEMIADGTFVQIFAGITSDLDKLVLTQAQIIRFCEKHPTWLRQEGYATFFLTKVNGEYFVAHVFVLGVGLYVNVCRLEDDYVWSAEYLHRVVCPQLMPSVA